MTDPRRRERRRARSRVRDQLQQMPTVTHVRLTRSEAEALVSVPDVDELREAIAEATRFERHVHAANHPCEGCVRRSAAAVSRLLS
jgi:hypothetical protein